MNFEKFHSQLDLPFLETNNECIKEILQTLEYKFGLKTNSKQTFIDLGSGNGSIVIFTGLNHNIKSYGIEIDQKLFIEAKNRLKKLKKEGARNKILLRKIKFKLGDFFQVNLKIYDFIYIYSLPSMHKYLKHVFNTAKIGAIIISHRFQLEGFDSFLKYEYKLAHANGKQETFTFFYKKI